MTAYLTRDEFFAITIPGDAFTGLPNEQIDQVLEYASRQADSYLAKRHTLPLIDPGPALKAAVGDLAQFTLLSRRGFRPGSGNDEISVNRRDTALRWLSDVARGIVDSGATDSTPELDEEGAQVASDTQISWRTLTGPKVSE